MSVCPYCHVAYLDDNKLVKTYYESLEESGIMQTTESTSLYNRCITVLKFSQCPNCSKITVYLRPLYETTRQFPYFSFSFSFPPTNAKSIPEYVPAAIQQDYFEAVSIVESSPKASATLARRCLQGMIHDFWNIHEKNLNAEISSLRERIPASQWQAIDALRKIGNIGAHMEQDINKIIDVDPEESKLLLQLIELLIDKWYVARHDEEALLGNIKNIADEKEHIRKSKTSSPSDKEDSV